VERPVRIENRAQLVYLLTQAAELEHGIMCCYLFGAFTMKESTAEGVTDDQMAAMKRWRRELLDISVQEMLHLALVCNVLTAVGGAPMLRRPNLPSIPRSDSKAVKLRLTPFGLQAMDEFIDIERPEVQQRAGARVPEEFATVQPKLSDIFSSERHFSTQGHLYNGIRDGLEYLSHKYGEEGLFVGRPEDQADETFFSIPAMMAVHDLASASLALKTIVEQGEGASEDFADSHYNRFMRIREEYDAVLAVDPAFTPGRPALANPFSMMPSDKAEGDVNLIDDPQTADVSNLLDGCYELMIQMLGRIFVHAEESHDELARLADTTIGLMAMVVQPLGSALSSLPAGKSHPGFTAGPGFRLSRGASIPTHKEAAWAVFRERLGELAAYSRYLQAEKNAPAVLGRVNTALSRFAAALGEV